MTSSHFFISYSGNKRFEYKYLDPFLNFDGVENIIEPFCGSSAISFNIWMKYPHLNFYLNDINTNLINIYNLFKKYETEEIYDNLNDLKRKYCNPDDYKKFVKSLDKEKEIDPFIYFFISRLSLITPFSGMMHFENYNKKNDFFKLTKLQLKFIEFIRSPNVYISNDDWFVLFDKYKYDTNTMFVIDPPYIKSDNSFYNKQGRNTYDDNVYKYFEKNKITTFNSKIFVILELIAENNEIFGEDNIIETYDKEYKLSKKKTKHAIFSNLNLTQK